MNAALFLFIDVVCAQNIGIDHSQLITISIDIIYQMQSMATAIMILSSLTVMKSTDPSVFGNLEQYRTIRWQRRRCFFRLRTNSFVRYCLGIDAFGHEK